MASLLTIPRELRDNIIEHVLFSIQNQPPLFQGHHNEERSAPWTPLPAMNRHSGLSLALTNRQLYAEVLERASAIEGPLALDLLMISDDIFESTWLTVPLRMGPVIERFDIHIRAAPFHDDIDVSTSRLRSIEMTLEEVLRHVLAGGPKDRSVMDRWLTRWRNRDRRLANKMKARGPIRIGIPHDDYFVQKKRRRQSGSANGGCKQNGRWKGNQKKKGKGRARHPGRNRWRANAGSISRHAIKSLNIHFNTREEHDRINTEERKRQINDLKRSVAEFKDFWEATYFRYPVVKEKMSGGIYIDEATQLYATHVGRIVMLVDGEPLATWDTLPALEQGLCTLLHGYYDEWEIRQVIESMKQGRKITGLDK